MKSINTKKIICVILVITLMFSLVSCGNAKEYKGKPGEGAVKVGVILQGSIDDAGFNQSCYEMCQALEKILMASLYCVKKMFRKQAKLRQ